MAGSGKITKMLTWVGPALDDDQLIERLPSPLAESLRSRNGYISALGGFHLRGVCVGPEWHSIRAAWEGPDAIHRLFPTVLRTDIPFAQDCFGDQFLIRNGKVLRLESETGTVQAISPNWVTFMEAVEGNAFTFLRLQPLKRFQDQGGILAPGQLLSVYPPFVAVGGGASIRELLTPRSACPLWQTSHVRSEQGPPLGVVV
jgi:hypothetical protein